MIAKEERDRLRQQDKVVKQTKDNEKFREQYLKLQRDLEEQHKKLKKELLEKELEYLEAKKRA